MQNFSSIEKESCDHLHTDKATGATTNVTKLKLDRGIDWKEALVKIKEADEIKEAIVRRQKERRKQEAIAVARAEGRELQHEGLVALGRGRAKARGGKGRTSASSRYADDDDDDETLGGFIVNDDEDDDGGDDSGGSSSSASGRKPFGGWNGFWQSNKHYRGDEKKKLILLAVELPQSAGVRYNSQRK